MQISKICYGSDFNIQADHPRLLKAPEEVEENILIFTIISKCHFQDEVKGYIKAGIFGNFAVCEKKVLSPSVR